MDPTEDILLEAEDKMDKTLKHLHEQFNGVRTGKASPALVENVMVPYYGTPTRLREIAGISTPEPRLIVINPYDPSAVGDIEKAVLAANLGVTPISDGKIIRVPIPELSEERRKELVKVVRRMGEENRVAVRSIRRDANDAIKESEKKGDATEDDRVAILADIQKMTDEHIKKIDDMLTAKEHDIMAV